MRITEYKTLLNDQRIEHLIKESSVNYTKEKTLDNGRKIVTMMNEIFLADQLPEEHCWLLAFDSKMKLKGVIELSHGTVNQTVVNNRETAIKLLLLNCVQFVMIHNHPSGCCQISKEDVIVTKKLAHLGVFIGCPMLDSIVIGKNEFYSFHENANMPQISEDLIWNK